jgi:hypothetical protein
MGVKLKDTHLEVIIEVLQKVCDYKFRALRKASWQTFQDQYLTSIIEQIAANDFKLNNKNKSTLLWLLDQIVWSKVIIDGVPLKDGVPLIDTNLGQEAAAIIRAAVKGQLYYDSSWNKNEFHNLFE